MYIEHDVDNCKYSELLYEEYDTGYKEYYCNLIHDECYYPCPLDFNIEFINE